MKNSIKTASNDLWKGKKFKGTRIEVDNVYLTREELDKITGHTSPAILRKYIKAENLTVVEKITDKYDYFD